MFDTDLNVLPHLRFRSARRLPARLAEGQKTDVSAVALGANVRYGLIPASAWRPWQRFLFTGVLTFARRTTCTDFTPVARCVASRLTGRGRIRWLKSPS